MNNPEQNEPPQGKSSPDSETGGEQTINSELKNALQTTCLPPLAASSIPFDDNILEKLVVEKEKRISELRNSGESLVTQHQILIEESLLKSTLVMSASNTSHEGRVIQALELHTRHVSSALEYLRLYVLEHPSASLADLSEVTNAISFNQRALLNELPLANDLERFGSRSTLRETILEACESIVDSLNHYPIQFTGLYRFPRIPELLIDAALESIRIFFEYDALVPNQNQQKRIEDIGLGIATGMHLQLKTFFARTLDANEESSNFPGAVDLPLTHTFLASERLLRFVRRISGGINSGARTTDHTYEDALAVISKSALDIRANLKEIPYRPVLKEFPRDPQILYIDLLNPQSNQYRAYCSESKFILIPKTFSFGF